MVAGAAVARQTGKLELAWRIAWLLLLRVVAVLVALVDARERVLRGFRPRGRCG